MIFKLSTRRLVSAKEKLIKLIDKIITTMEEMFIETFEKSSRRVFESI